MWEYLYLHGGSWGVANLMTPRSRDGGPGPEPTVSAWIQLLWSQGRVAGAGDRLERRKAVGWGREVRDGGKEGVLGKEVWEDRKLLESASVARLGPTLQMG